MTFARPLSAALATLLIASCGGDSGTNSGNNSTMSATIAGASWSASLAVQASRGGNVLAISGTDGTYQILLTIPSVTAPGTFNFGVGNTGVAQVIQVSGTTASAWTTALVGGSGTLTLTTFTAERATGTFSFSGTASPGTPATGTRPVTAGSFDVRF